VSSSITDDRLLVHEPNRRLAARTGGPVWKSQDLCTPCQSVNLTQICSKGSLYGSDVSLRISETSTCPLCRFLTSKLRRRDAGSEGSVTIGLGRHVIDGIDHVCIRHDDQFEYILQMTDGELLKEPGRIGQYRQIDPTELCVGSFIQSRRQASRPSFQRRN
jgi:hypothetical protein